MIPLPFTCTQERYTAGVTDDHGNETPSWASPVTVACFWWIPQSSEPASSPTGGTRVAVDASLVVDSTVVVDHRDVFTIDAKRFEVIGLPTDYDHGPWWSPNRRVIELKWVA